MSTDTRRTTGTDQGVDKLSAAWCGFEQDPGRTGSTSATSSSATTPRTPATPRFLAGADRAHHRRSGRARPRCSPPERERGIHDVDADTPSTITSHAPGYIDRDNELIVGLQTDAPLKRAIMPNGGWRMVEDALSTYGYQLDPRVEDDLHQVPQDPQRTASSTPTRRRPRPPAARTSSPACRTRTAAAGSSATTAAWRSTAWTA